MTIKEDITMNAKFDRDYLMQIVCKLLRYIILMDRQNEPIMSDQSEFKIVTEPLYRTVTITYNDKDDHGDIHRLVNIFKINTTTNKLDDIEYTVENYIQAFHYYISDVTETIGGIEITHHAGEKIVTRYALYDHTVEIPITYIDNNGQRVSVTDTRPEGSPQIVYNVYQTTVYDEETGDVIHAAGDVIVNPDGTLSFYYVVAEYEFEWQLVVE